MPSAKSDIGNSLIDSPPGTLANCQSLKLPNLDGHYPIQVTLAEGWTSTDRGHWIMCKPPTAPVGMDIYELGRYSCDDRAKTPELLMQIPRDVALDGARRVKPDASGSELKAAKVGKYDALLFEATLKAREGGDVNWRHWVFMAGDRCFLVVSTLFPDQEKALLPEVESMIRSI